MSQRQKISAILLALACCPAAARAGDFRIERSTILTSSGEYHWSQSRAALLPGEPARVIVLTQQIEKRGSHGYRDIFSTETADGAKTWTTPQRLASLARSRSANGQEAVMGDIWPQWHQATKTVLATGKTFGFKTSAKDTDSKDDRSMERVAYAVYSPATQQWSGMQQLTLPEKDHAGKVILEPNSGCVQRLDLPNGDILLPIRYRQDPASRCYTSIVARCSFDGKTLTYHEHGSELTVPQPRGLYEPSVTHFQARYFLTMRADDTAYVTSGKDGLNYAPVTEWKFDDGQPLGSYNAQQHWVTHSDALYLTYTRRGTGNDHVFRNRAPLFIARVDPEKLCVLRATEQILLPETGLDLAAGFGVTDVSAKETWVVSSETGFPAARIDEPGRVLLARIVWEKPNGLFIAPQEP